MNEKKSDKNPSINDVIIREIRNTIAELDYGTVTIKIHDSKIVQVEITEKKRFDDAGFVERGGGI
jgi:hypothetical protein